MTWYFDNSNIQVPQVNWSHDVDDMTSAAIHILPYKSELFLKYHKALRQSNLMVKRHLYKSCDGVTVNNKATKSENIHRETSWEEAELVLNDSAQVKSGGAL